MVAAVPRVRRIAILVDGGFFLKRLRYWKPDYRESPEQVADILRRLCKRHVQKLVGEDPEERNSRWLDHVYRLFYYDAEPYTGQPYHPLYNRQIAFAQTDEAIFRRELFDQIKRKRKFALRLGTLTKEADWSPYNRHMKALLKIWHVAPALYTAIFEDGDKERLATTDVERALRAWMELVESDVRLPLRQKGVDMKIGLDIASMTLKHQIDTIVLVTGDSDFIPAAKVARREGVEFILDPMWQSVEGGLMEHIDGLQSGF